MKYLAKILRLIALYFKVNLASAMEYRGNFWLQAFGMALSNGSFVFFWWIAFQQIAGNIGGYDFKDVMFIWAVTSSAYGAANIVFANMSAITRIIASGELDTFLLQPQDVLLNLLCAKTSPGAWGDLGYGLILVALTRGADKMAWSMFIVGVLIGGFLMTALAVSAHSFTFYFGDASLLGGMALEFMLNFSVYPQGIYRGFVRLLMVTVIPSAFMVHIPLRLVHSFSWLGLLSILAGCAAYCSLSYWFFYRGLKKYESGNLVITRI